MPQRGNIEDERRRGVAYSFITKRERKLDGLKLGQFEHYNPITNIILDLTKLDKTHKQERYEEIFLGEYFPEQRITKREDEEYLDIYWSFDRQRYFPVHRWIGDDYLERERKAGLVWFVEQNKYCPKLIVPVEWYHKLYYREEDNTYHQQNGDSDPLIQLTIQRIQSLEQEYSDYLEQLVRKENNLTGEQGLGEHQAINPDQDNPRPKRKKESVESGGTPEDRNHKQRKIGSPEQPKDQTITERLSLALSLREGELTEEFNESDSFGSFDQSTVIQSPSHNNTPNRRQNNTTPTTPYQNQDVIDFHQSTLGTTKSDSLTSLRRSFDETLNEGSGGSEIDQQIQTENSGSVVKQDNGKRLGQDQIRKGQQRIETNSDLRGQAEKQVTYDINPERIIREQEERIRELELEKLMRQEELERVRSEEQRQEEVESEKLTQAQAIARTRRKTLDNKIREERERSRKAKELREKNRGQTKQADKGYQFPTVQLTVFPENQDIDSQRKRNIDDQLKTRSPIHTNTQQIDHEEVKLQRIRQHQEQERIQRENDRSRLEGDLYRIKGNLDEKEIEIVNLHQCQVNEPEPTRQLELEERLELAQIEFEGIKAKYNQVAKALDREPWQETIYKSKNPSIGSKLRMDRGYMQDNRGQGSPRGRTNNNPNPGQNGFRPMTQNGFQPLFDFGNGQGQRTGFNGQPLRHSTPTDRRESDNARNRGRRSSESRNNTSFRYENHLTMKELPNFYGKKHEEDVEAWIKLFKRRLEWKKIDPEDPMVKRDPELLIEHVTEAVKAMGACFYDEAQNWYTANVNTAEVLSFRGKDDRTDNPLAGWLDLLDRLRKHFCKYGETEMERYAAWDNLKFENYTSLLVFAKAVKKMGESLNKRYQDMLMKIMAAGGAAIYATIKPCTNINEVISELAVLDAVSEKKGKIDKDIARSSIFKIQEEEVNNLKQDFAQLRLEQEEQLRALQESMVRTNAPRLTEQPRQGQNINAPRTPTPDRQRSYTPNGGYVRNNSGDRNQRGFTPNRSRSNDRDRRDNRGQSPRPYDNRGRPPFRQNGNQPGQYRSPSGDRSRGPPPQQNWGPPQQNWGNSPQQTWNTPQASGWAQSPNWGQPQVNQQNWAPTAQQGWTQPQPPPWAQPQQPYQAFQPQQPNWTPTPWGQPQAQGWTPQAQWGPNIGGTPYGSLPNPYKFVTVQRERYFQPRNQGFKQNQPYQGVSNQGQQGQQKKPFQPKVSWKDQTDNQTRETLKLVLEENGILDSEQGIYYTADEGNSLNEGGAF